MILRLLLLFGLIFGSLAALIAFLITYQEYRKHKFEGWRLWKEALRTAAFTLAFFLGLCVLLAYVLPHID
jgi:hypothetical protein